jgi:hypothetical protein
VVDYGVCAVKRFASYLFHSQTWQVLKYAKKVDLTDCQEGFGFNKAPALYGLSSNQHSLGFTAINAANTNK